MLKRIVVRDPTEPQPLVFENPEQVFVAHSVDDVLSVLKAAESMLASGAGYLAGFVSFDAAPAFDPSFVAHRDPDFPLVCLGYFRNYAHESVVEASAEQRDSHVDWQLTTDAEHYTDAIARIHAEIARGNTYQINYTVRYRSDAAPSPQQLFDELGRNARYGAHLTLDSCEIVSASPELFFGLSGDNIVCKPMKGTAMRGLSRQDDLRRRDALANSEKDRAENIMITDMVRNDLGRIARPGSVVASELCAVEQHPTVWQMTSTVTAKTDAGMTDLLGALFPSASVTGAPKSASLKLIQQLEPDPRGVYTGAIGYFGADRRAQFNVAIRTACIDTKNNRAEYGVGSGIIWDSEAADEFRECQLKAEILQRRHQAPAFDLVETMLWTAGHGIAHLNQHLNRCADSAAYFDRSFDRRHVLAVLDAATAQLSEGAHRLRLLVPGDGGATVEVLPIPTTPKPFRLRLAPRPVDRHDPFLYHKTSHREVYTAATLGIEDCDDVLHWNADGEITETNFANVFLRRGNGYVTPPVSSGLLAGVLRGRLLQKPEFSEGRILRDELIASDEILLGNSLRGTFVATLVGV